MRAWHDGSRTPSDSGQSDPDLHDIIDHLTKATNQSDEEKLGQTSKENQSNSPTRKSSDHVTLTQEFNPSGPNLFQIFTGKHSSEEKALVPYNRGGQVVLYNTNNQLVPSFKAETLKKVHLTYSLCQKKRTFNSKFFCAPPLEEVDA